VESIFAQALGQDLSKVSGQEKRELLSRLLARLAHEIRNPLSSLHIHVQLLQEDVARSAPQLDEKFRSRFEIIHGELNRLETIVKQFVSLSGPAAISPDRINLGTIVSNVCALLQPEAASREVVLVNATEAPVEVQADPVQLTQALLNLVINAIQAIGRKGEIRIRAWLDAEARRAWIEVQDSGPGVEISRESAIFEPFYTTKPEGSGLGLWIVQQIVAAHRGGVRLANAGQGGAIFTIELPLD